MSHLDAVDKAVSAAGLDVSPVHAPLVELLRTLASQMDEGEPSTRLSAAYLSALKDLSRATALVKAKFGSPAGARDELEEFRGRLRKQMNVG